MTYQELSALSINELRRAPCECTSCPECKGSGQVYFSFGTSFGNGRYLGPHRSDDLDEMENCYTCRGQGTVDTCDRCHLLDEYEMEHDPWA